MNRSDDHQSVLQPQSGGKRRTLPEYLDQAQAEALIRCAGHPAAALLLIVLWRAGLRVSEALALEVADISLDRNLPTLRVSGKGGKARMVPVHPELAAALRTVVTFRRTDGRLIEVTRSTAWRWVRDAAERARVLGALPPGARVGCHTLCHSFARHLLLNGIPINYLSRWLGHSSIETTLIYLQLVPDPAGDLAMVP